LHRQRHWRFLHKTCASSKLERGQYDQCHACRRPITETDKQSEYYVPGVSCHHCIDEYADSQRERFAARELQVQLAKQRGEKHIGASANCSMEQRRELKREHKAEQRKISRGK
ncbi:MAG: hypothetical protein JKY01_11475, partial [Pseudomonadales bacterium]|nr:hypothetical protein [Pseudomonadales bacterium]